MNAPPEPTPVRILLVDDDPAHLRDLEAVLGGLGARLVTARDGEEALRALGDEACDAVLIAVRLPGLGGYETARLIRGRDPSRDTPIIFIADRDDLPAFPIEDAHALGAVDLLARPIVPIVLRSKLATLIERSRLARADAARRALMAEREQLLDRMPIAYVANDSAFRITHWNPAAERIFGFSREEAIGRTPYELFLPGSAHAFVKSVHERIVSGDMAAHGQNECLTKDGRTILCEWHNTPLRGDDGRVVGSLSMALDITDRVAAERAVRASEERLRLAQESARIGTWDRDLRTGAVSWSEGMYALLDREPGDAEPVASGWLGDIHPDDRAETLRRADEAIAAVGSFHAEFRVRRRDGSYRWIASKGSVHRAGDGAPARFLGVNADVHDRKLAELRQGLLAEAGRILGSSLDYEVTLAQVSRLVVPQFSDWCGLDLRTDDGQVRRLAVVHRDPEKVGLANQYRRRYPPRPDDPGGLMAVLRNGRPILQPELTDEDLVKGARDAEHLELLRSLDLKSYIVVPMMARGRTIGALTLAVAESSRRFGADDLRLAEELAARAALAVDNARLFSEAEESSRRRAEALHRHRTAEEQLTLLVEASGSLSASLDLPSVLDAILTLSNRLVSAHAYAVWRYEPASGRWGIAHAAGLSEGYREASIRMDSGMPEMPEAPIVAEDVLAVPILGEREAAYEREGIRSLLAVPLKVRGETTGTLVFYYRSPHRFSEVEVRVATALANLAGSAIGSAELYDELRANGRRKDEFLAMLAHELRNPLSSIAHGVSLLQRPEGGDEDRDWATRVIGRQVKHLSRLIDDLLDVSRVSRGKIELRRRRLDAEAVIRQAIETAQPFINERKHRLHVSYDAGALAIEADPTRLEQIVVNLLTNAAKYTDAGGDIWLTARREDEHVAITIRDNGIGIAPEQLPRMFDLFAQGDRSLARSEGGLGIGLTLVKALAELHGGSVAARSEGPGKGSEFTVRLPAARPRAIGEDRPRAPAGPRRAGGRKILVIDDNADTARGLARLLRLLGHELRTAHSGPEGIAAALDSRPDVILLDIGLPGMDGYEVARRLRQVADLAGVVIIAISGYGQDEHRERSRSAGIDHHLVKPIDPDTLVTLLDANQADS